MFYTWIVRKIYVDVHKTVRRTPAVLAALAVLAVSLTLHASIAPPKLPPDESGLGALIEDQLIDSIQYDMLTVFYALPLSVPQGELAQLEQVFPDISDMLPTAAELETYHPFDNRTIQKLFADFPVLADLEPILRFNVSARQPKQAVTGEVIFGINKSSIDELKGHRARFRVKSQYVSMEGNVNLNDTGAMWHNRRVDLSHSGTTAQIGNFKQPIPGELFWGRFARLTLEEDDDEIAANWLYGGSNTWNGTAITTKEIPKVSTIGASAFYHQRGIGERAAGGAVDWKINKKIRINAGLTGAGVMGYINTNNNAGDTDDSSNGNNGNDGNDYDDRDDGGINNDINDINNIIEEYVYTAHLYGEYRDKTWRITAETGVPLAPVTAAPALSVRANYRIKESSAEYQYIAYPQNFPAPMSRVKRQLLSEAGEKESAQSPPVQKHRLKMTVPIDIPLIDMTRFVPELDLTQLDETVKRVHARAEIRARINKADITLRHASRIFTTGTDSTLNTSSAALKLQTNRPVEIRTTAQSTYGYYKNPRHAYTLELHYTGLPNMIVTPFVRGRYVTSHEYWLGLKSELHLYQKTWTGVTIELPVGVKGADNVYIKGSASYAF